jgi:DAK2 domain fusion protein YloV
LPPLTGLAAADLRTAVLRYRDALRAHQEELNRLNVYPVPDGDTGTNMALTLEAVSTELATAETMAEVCHAMSRGSLMGARGNSGVITSQILRGLADEFHEKNSIEGHDLAQALRRAADAAYQAVLRPVEGTILTVVRSAAEAVENGAGDAPLLDVLEVASVAARDAVERTPDQLPALAAAGVVDAGGRGFALLLDALLEVTDGRPIPEPAVITTPAAVAAHLRGDDVSSLRYEVMYLLEAADGTIPGLKESWGAIGDSIVVVGGEGMWNCHVHTNDIGAAIEAGIEAGRPCKIRVTDLFEEVEEEQWVREAAAAGTTDADELADGAIVETAVVAVAVGDGLRRLLRSLGVQNLVAGGQSMNPSTAQILEAVEACASESVIVLPNNKNIVPVARQVDELTEKHVAVVPTVSVPEALAALVDYDPNADLAVNEGVMSAALARVHTGEVTQAVRDAVGECGPISAGDWLALTREGIVAAVATPAEAVAELLARLVDDDSEIVTVLVGGDAPAADTQHIREQIEFRFPHVEVEFHDGGQPLYPYLIGVE